MKMFFHGGCNEVILFDFWRIDSVGGLVGSMVACLVLGVLYEGLKFLREDILRRQLMSPQTPSSSASTRRYNTLRASEVQQELPSSGDSSVIILGADADVGPIDNASPAPPSTRAATAVRTVETNFLSGVHLLLTLMQFVQVTLAYCLMLIFMTFNSWLCLATVLGTTVGYFFFGWRKTVVLGQEDDDPCH